jgi:hypothetical protein
MQAAGQNQINRGIGGRQAAFVIYFTKLLSRVMQDQIVASPTMAAELTNHVWTVEELLTNVSA